jgi:hypothetical protein
MTLWDLLDERAAILQGLMHDRNYPQGFERVLAEELIAAIPADCRMSALRILAHDHIEPRITAVDCLLDETDVRSYETANDMSRLLVDAIVAQDRAPAALTVLVTGEIVQRYQQAEVIAGLRT